MKLLIFGAGWPPSTFVDRRLQGLLSMGVEVTVVVTASRDQPQPGQKNLSLLYLRRGGNFRSAVLALVPFIRQCFRNPAKAIQGIRAAAGSHQSWKIKLLRMLYAARMAETRPDIIHFEWNSTAIDYGWVTELFQVPNVVSCRGRQVNIWPLLPGNEKFTDDLRHTFQKADAVHCVCQDIANAAKKYGMPPDKAHVIYTAVDTQFFSPTKREVSTDSAVQILMVGALIWRKNYSDALVAVRNLIDDGYSVHLDIIGDGPEMEHLIFSIVDMGLGNHVSLLGSRSPSYVRNAMQCSDVYLLTSLSEGIANVVVEAMACGIPVVTTDCGGMREAVSDGIEGFVVPSRDPWAITRALEVLVRDSSLRERMGAAGRVRVLDQFNLERQAAQFYALYAGLHAFRSGSPVLESPGKWDG